MAVETDLLVSLTHLVRNLVSWARANVVPIIAVERRNYHADDVGRNARSIIEAMRLEAERLAATAQGQAQAAIEREAVRHSRQFAAGIRAQAQIDLSALIRDDDLVDLISIRSEEFNRLITSLAQNIHDQIERETLGSIFEGRSNEDVAKSLQGIEGIGRSRARLIARDQASKLNGAMNQFRQGQAGVTHYKWKTIIDGRERDTHHANNGRVFAWAKPPATGHPGHEINCRCRGLAIITADPDEIEGSATPIGSDPEDIGDFFAANLPAIRSVASVPRSNIGLMTAQDIAEKLAQSVDLQAKIAAAGKAIDDVIAEKLVVELYGFLPRDADIESLIGSRVTRMFASRRTILVAAAKDRLQMIERVLRQASVRAPASASPAAPALAPRPAAPKAAREVVKSYPKGEYFERVAGVDQPIAVAEDEGRAFVRSQGARTGDEWALVHDDRGRVVARISSGKPGFVGFSNAQLPELFAPGHRMTFHHNHPSSSSFSIADLRSFSWAPGLEKVFAHGADGSQYMVRNVTAGAVDAAKRIDAQVVELFREAIRANAMTILEADSLAAHVRMLALSNAGAVVYEYELAGTTRARAQKHEAFIQGVIQSIGGR